MRLASPRLLRGCYRTLRGDLRLLMARTLEPSLGPLLIVEVKDVAVGIPEPCGSELAGDMNIALAL